MKKKHIIIIAVVAVLLCYGLLANNSKDNTQETANTETQTNVRGGGTADLTEAETEQQDETAEPETTEQAKEEVEHRTGDSIVGISEKSIDDLKPVVYNTVRNDVTGKWKCLVIAENNIDITEYALSCYENYFDSDETILAVVNLTTKTTASISKPAGFLDVSLYEYTDGEEQDAKAMFSGTPLGEYFVYTDNGDIEKVNEEN
jgi:hypothetical protein